MMSRLVISIVFLSLVTEGRREYEFGRSVRIRRRAKLLAVNLPADENSSVYRDSNALFKEDVFRNLHMSGSFSYSYSASAPTKKDEFGDILSGEAPSLASIGNSTIEAGVSAGAILEGGMSSLVSISNTTTESEVSGNAARASTQESPVATGSGASSKTAGIAVCTAGAVMVLVSAAVVFARRQFREKESPSHSEC